MIVPIALTLVSLTAVYAESVPYPYSGSVKSAPVPQSNIVSTSQQTGKYYSAPQQPSYVAVPSAPQALAYSSVPSGPQAISYSAVPSGQQAISYSAVPSGQQAISYSAVPSGQQAISYSAVPSTPQSAVQYNGAPSAQQAVSYSAYPSGPQAISYSAVPSTPQSAVPYNAAPAAAPAALPQALPYVAVSAAPQPTPYVAVSPKFHAAPVAAVPASPVAISPKFASVVQVAQVKSGIADKDAQIVNEGREVGYDGSFNYGFETENGISVKSKGYIKPAVSPTDEPIQVIEGSYTYFDAYGKPQTIQYIADENGYRAFGEAIPQPPEEILKTLAHRR